MAPVIASTWFSLTSILLAIFITNSQSAIQYTQEVQIQSGRLRGLVETLATKAKVRKYLGVPFARADRFEKPRDPKAWAGVKNMTSFGKVCYQTPYLKLTYAHMSEDCLNLNIYVPDKAVSSNANLPVMLWIHGGSFWFGSNKDTDGSYLAVEGGLIFIAINYRLEKFGFLANKDFNIGGNFGLYDQLHALKWVKKNIAKFGGDPNKVTIIGNSAGGVSVSWLTMSLLANGLFNNAIIQSGPPTMDALLTTYTKKDVFKKYVAKINCTLDANMKKCLKAVTAETFVSNNAPGDLIKPVVDGHILTDTPRALIKKKSALRPVNVLIGVSADDGSCFTRAIPELSEGFYAMDKNNFTRQGFLKQAEWIGTDTKAVQRKEFIEPFNQILIHQYTDQNNIDNQETNRRMFLDAISDGAFLAPTVAFAKARSTNGAGKTYFYINEHNAEIPNVKIPSWINGYHESTKYLSLGLGLDKVSTAGATVSRQVIQLWSNFAKTSDPNKPTTRITVTWPQYDSANQNYLVIKPNMQVRSKPRLNYVAFWNDLVPALNQTIDESCPPPALKGSKTKPKIDLSKITPNRKNLHLRLLL